MTIEINVSLIREPKELHELIGNALGFPDYYGRNWDAFDECANDPDIEKPKELKVIGIASLAVNLPREAKLMKKCFSDASANGVFEIEWEE